MLCSFQSRMAGKYCDVVAVYCTYTHTGTHTHTHGERGTQQRQQHNKTNASNVRQNDIFKTLELTLEHEQASRPAGAGAPQARKHTEYRRDIKKTEKSDNNGTHKLASSKQHMTDQGAGAPDIRRQRIRIIVRVGLVAVNIIPDRKRQNEIMK